MQIVKSNFDFSNNVERAMREIDPFYDSYHGIVVVGSHNQEEIEKKMELIRFARENKIPFFGICFGMQLALIEYGKNVLKIDNATSEEISKGAYVIHKLPDMNVGISKVEGDWESHWHHFAFNDKYKQQYEKDWNLSFENGILEYCALKDHPFFYGTQFHPEYRRNHPLLAQFITTCKHVGPRV